jgi:hypothetical protein
MRVRAERFDRPYGTAASFATIAQHFVLGYFRRVPPGQLAAYPFPYVDAHGLKPGLCFLSLPPSSRRRFAMARPC